MDQPQRLVNDIASRKPEVERIVFNISRKQYTDLHIQTDVRDQLVEHMQNQNHKLATLIGDVIPLSMEDYLPLQAADILCWHLQRSYSGLPVQPKDQENMDIFRSKEVCGLEITTEHIQTMAASILRRHYREKKHGTDADNFASAMSRLSGFSKSEIMGAIDKEDKYLRRYKPRKSK